MWTGTRASRAAAHAYQGGDRGWVFWSSRSTGGPPARRPPSPPAGGTARCCEVGADRGTRFSIGRTRMEQAPACAAAEQLDHLAAVDDGVHGVHAGARERQHGGRVEAGQQADHLVQRAVRRVQHQVALVAGRETLRITAAVVRDRAAGPARDRAPRGAAADSNRSATGARPFGAASRRFRRGRHRLGGIQPRRQLDRPVDGTVRRHALAGEELRSGDGVRGSHPGPSSSAGAARRRRGTASGSVQRPNPSAHQLVRAPDRLGQLVAPGDCRLDGSVLRPRPGCRRLRANSTSMSHCGQCVCSARPVVSTSMPSFAGRPARRARTCVPWTGGARRNRRAHGLRRLASRSSTIR